MDAYFKLLPDAVFTASPSDKEAVLRCLSARFASVYDLCDDMVFEALQERETLGSTGFGRGVAIPHARIEGIHRPLVTVLKPSKPVDFAASDGMSVDLVFGLLSPHNAGASHLHALAAISRLVRDEAMHRSLLDASGSQALYALLTRVSQDHVA